MTARLNFLPANKQTRDIVARIYGEDNVKIINNEIVIIEEPIKTNISPLHMQPEQIINPKDLEETANYIIKNFNTDFDNINMEDIIRSIPNPIIYSQLGIISELHKLLNDVSLNTDKSIQREILLKRLLPFMLENMNAYSCHCLNVNIKLQQSILSYLKIGFYTKKFGLKKTKEIVESDGVGSKIYMDASQSILCMLDSYTCFANNCYTLPLHLAASSIHFISDGAVQFTSEMQSSMRNMFQSNQDPMPVNNEIRHKLKTKIIIDKDYVWRYLKFSVDCVNRIISYANNPFNFLDDQRRLIPENQLQFFTSIQLLYADVASINYTSSRHIKYNLAFGAIEKFANLILGHIKTKGAKKSIMERCIVHIILTKNTGEEIESIIEERIGGRMENVSENLKSICNLNYLNFHSKVKDSFNGSEEYNIASFHKLRNFYAHGTFLDYDIFKNIFLMKKVSVPSEISFIPYHLIIALSCNPNRFFKYFEEQANKYDKGKFDIKNGGEEAGK